MNNEKMRIEIAAILQSRAFNNSPYRNIEIGYVTALDIADALIAAGIGDVETVQNISASATAIAVLEAAQAKYRAEVFERAGKIAVNKVFDYTWDDAVAQAEEELAEERKDA